MNTSTYQEVKHAQSKHVKGYAHMTMVVKPAQHPDTQTVKKDRKNEILMSFLFP